MTRPARRPDERGAILILTSILALSLLTFTAFAVDIGHESEVKRHLHLVSDVAAQDGLYGLGSTDALSRVANYAVASAARNGHPMSGSNQLKVEIGRWAPDTTSFGTIPCADPAPAPAPAPPCPSPPCVVTVSAASTLPLVLPTCVGKPDQANAVRVTASNSVVWNLVSGSQGLSALAVAVPAVFTGLEVGTFDANAGTSTTQTALLNAALGVNLANYDGLAGATVNANDLSSALGFGSPDQMLKGSTTYKKLLDAAATALSKNGDATGSATVKNLSTAVASKTLGGAAVALGPLLGGSAGTGQGSAIFGNAGVDALGLIKSAYEASVINGTTFASTSGTITVPGATGVDSGVKLIQAPAFGFGGSCNATTTEPSTTALCAQAHTAQLEGQIIVHLPSVTVPLVGLGSATITGNIPLYFDNAGAHAWVSSYCPTMSTGHLADVDAWGHTGVSHVAFGQDTGITGGTGQIDLSDTTGGSATIQGPNGNVSVKAVTFIEVTIPAIGIDAHITSNGVVSILDTGATHLQAANPPPSPPATPSFYGPFQPPVAGTPPASSGSPGYRGPDRMAPIQYQMGQTVSPPDPAGKALADGLVALGNALPDPKVQLDRNLQVAGISAAVQATIDTGLGGPLRTELSSIQSIMASLDQTVFAPLNTAFQAAVGGADVTNLADRNQAIPDGTVCVPQIVQ